MADAQSIFFYRRGSDSLEEEVVLGDALVRWAYRHERQGFAGRLLFQHPLVSRIMGYYCDSRLSRARIQRTIELLAIDESEFQEATDSYATFNAFFTRKLKPESRPFDAAQAAFSAPADGRYLLYPKISQDSVVPVKGCAYSVDDLLAGDASAFHNGDVLVVRLCPADYHRFHFPSKGKIIEQRHIPGKYHSVNPIALATGINVFCENTRTITTMDSEHGGIAYIEVGAFGVGSIVQTCAAKSVDKMDEKGYFAFGGSTLVLFTEAGRLNWADDLVKNSAGGHETLVLCGDTIATLG